MLQKMIGHTRRGFRPHQGKRRRASIICSKLLSAFVLHKRQTPLSQNTKGAGVQLPSAYHRVPAILKRQLEWHLKAGGKGMPAVSADIFLGLLLRLYERHH